MDIFLDESGDLGFNFSFPRTTKYFVISAIIVPDGHVLNFETEISRKISRLKKHHDIPKIQELKAYHSNDRIFMGVIDIMCSQPIEIHSIILNKIRVDGSLHHNTQIIYNYLCGILLTPILIENANVRLVIDPRSAETARPMALPEYLETKAFETLVSQERFGELGNLNLAIARPESTNCHGLQFADFAANATFKAYERENWSMRRRLTRKITREEKWFF